MCHLLAFFLYRNFGQLPQACKRALIAQIIPLVIHSKLWKLIIFASFIDKKIIQVTLVDHKMIEGTNAHASHHNPVVNSSQLVKNQSSG